MFVPLACEPLKSLCTPSHMDYAVDLYAVLGLSRTATASEVRRRCLRLAIKLHPDENPGSDGTEFKEVLYYNAVTKVFPHENKRERRP
mmetsp:Transcript_5857/g.11619  ORF Transcript_5857/g.11619 Transcript_5857/m.11619 type:complete len:88 (-) Transcript_5857:48-311(-)